MASGFLENKKDMTNTIEYDDIVDEITSFKVQTVSIRTVIGENINHTEYGMFMIFGVNNVEYSVPINPEIICALIKSAYNTIDGATIFRANTSLKDEDENYNIRIVTRNKRIQIYKLHGVHKIKIVYDFKEDDFKLFISELYTNYILNNPDKNMHEGVSYNNIMW